MASSSFKVVLLGEGRVGKTCVSLRYVDGDFSPEQKSTVQATYRDKRLNVGKKSVKLMIWDTAGQERFHALSSIYYREANGALLVYDITDRDSFTKVRNWVKELRKMVGKNIVLVIAGNKADLEKNRQVNEDEALAYAQSVGATHMLCSAKTGKNIEAIFLELTKGMLQQAAAEEPTLAGGAAGASGAGVGAGAGVKQGTRSRIDITDDDAKPQSSGCC